MSTQRRVVWSVTPEQAGSPYISGIVGALRRRGWTVDPLSLRDLTTSRNQIVHVQWPEHVSRGPNTARTIAKHIRAMGLLAAIRQRGHRVVVTAHNLAPHGEFDRFDAWFRSTLLDLAEVMIVLVPEHEAELRKGGQIHRDMSVRTIRHPIGDYHPSERPRDEATARTTLLVLGLIHPYHRILQLVDVLASRNNTRPVEVVGRVASAGFLLELEQKAAEHDWLSIRAGFVSDEELGPIVSRTAAVVSLQGVPFNSGAPFFALPRHLPVILSEGAQSRILVEEIGEEWVFEAPAAEHDLDLGALDQWLALERGIPELGNYTPEVVANQHAELYELLLQDE